MIINPVPEPSRQSWVALLFIIGTFFRRIVRQAWPLLILAYFRPNEESGRMAFFLWILLAMLLTSLVLSLLNYFRFYYWLDGGNLNIEQGVLKKTKLSVPFDRIQSINTEQNLFYRLFGVVKVEADTAGSKGSEAKIEALNYQLAHDIKHYVLSHKKHKVTTESNDSMEAEVEEPVVAATTEQVLQTLGIGQVLKIGIAQNHFRAIGILLAFLLARFDDAREIMGEKIDDIETLSQNAVSAGIMVYSALAILVLLGSIIASILSVFARYYGFKLLATHNGVKTISGLFTKREKQITFQKTQLFQYAANPMQRWLATSSVRVFQAASNTQAARTAMLTPGCDNEGIEQLTRLFFSDKALPDTLDNSIQPGYVVRKSIFGVWLLGVLVAAVLLLFEQYVFMWLPLIWMIYGTLKNYFFYRCFRFGFTPDTIQVKSGFLTLRNRIIEWKTIQAVEIFQGYYQQHKDIGDLVLYTAGGKIVLPFLKLSEARLIKNYALYKVESSVEDWM